MKIHEYNEMMAYLTRPAPKKVASLSEEYYGKDRLDWMENFSDQMSFEDYLRWKRPGSFAHGGVIGKGGMFQGEDLGYRTGFKKLKRSDPPWGLITRGERKGLYFVRSVGETEIPKGAYKVGERIYFSGKNAKENAEKFYNENISRDFLTETQKKNIQNWKKANPNLNFDDLSATVKSSIKKTGRTDLGTIGQGKGQTLLKGKDSPFYKPLDAEGEKIAKHVYGTTDISDSKDRRLTLVK